jgi:N-acetylmuramoyl-L-alanine amidase
MELRKFAVFLFVYVIGLFPQTGQASPVTIDNLRMWRAPDHTRLVFDLSGPVTHNLFTLKNPDRIVLDIDNVGLKKSLPNFEYNGPLLSGIRTGKKGTGLRIVLDMKQGSNPRTYLLKPYDQYGYRLVVDLHQAAVAAPVRPTAKTSPDHPEVYSGPKPRTGPIVIAIDAGHGGDDPGAIGPRYHTREKDVVLAIAKDLKRLIDRDPNLRAVMTRSGDYFVPLRKRIEIAQQKDAELFVSIHADSLPHSHARGSSVYALSQRGASSAQARLLANRENASDLIGGIDLSETDDVLYKVLVDMTQTAIIASSIRFGRDMLKDLRKVGPIHIKKVGLAGFAVLKSAKFPSILVETTFISHPGEERKLRSRSYRRKMAKAIYDGIKRYVNRNTLRPRTNSHTIARSVKPTIHIVKRGDTLSEIAATYSVNVTALKFANNLRDNKLIIGKRLVIPN